MHLQTRGASRPGRADRNAGRSCAGRGVVDSSGDIVIDAMLPVWPWINLQVRCAMTKFPLLAVPIAE
jgi:hypothetical protein